MNLLYPTLRIAIVVSALAFSSLAKAQAFVFDHQWMDFEGKPRSLSIEVGEQRVRDALTNSRDLYGYKDIFRSIIDNAKILAKELSTPRVKARVFTYDMTYRIEFEYVDGHHEEAMTIKGKIESFINGAYDDLKPVTYYRRRDDMEGLSISYEDVVSDFQDIFTLVNDAFRKTDLNKTDAARINDRLAFLQSIQYDDLLNNDFELMTPIRMLAEGRGDCESKQVFLAGMLKQMYPGRSVQLIVLPNKEHIVTAFEMPELPAELTIDKDGRRFLIMDATGPSYIKVSDSKIVIEENDMRYGKLIWNPI